MDGAQRIAAERRRQVKVEGYTAKGDARHTSGELAWAAVCYAAPDRVYVRGDTSDGIAFVDPWPWEKRYDKRRSNGLICSASVGRERRIDLLTKAGALIAAEIDRLQRLG